MRFEKWQAAGNAYLVMERGELAHALTPARVTRICHPDLGAGSDGILVLGTVSPGHVRVQILNPDGSEAEFSGNGSRIAAGYVAGRDPGAVARELGLAAVGVQDPHPGRGAVPRDHQDAVAAGPHVGMADPLDAGRRQLQRKVGLLHHQIGVADAVPLLETHGRGGYPGLRPGGGDARRRLPADP